MQYYLVQPLEGTSGAEGVGTIRQIFENEAEAKLWFAENETNPDFAGWYVVPESEIGKLN